MLTGRAYTFTLQLLLHLQLHSLCPCLSSPLAPFISDYRNLKIGYFSQHHVDQLDLNVSAVELLSHKFPGVLGLGVQEKGSGYCLQLGLLWGAAEQLTQV